jgi:hypothetical protein
MARQEINQLEEEMHRANQAEIARRKKAMLEMDERGQLSQEEINHRLEGNILQDPYGACKVAKQITEREMVNHPDHYQGNKFEVIDVIEDYDLGFSLGNAIKYILRADKKGNKKQDLKKAMWYIQREVNTGNEDV